jgi:hypothetical protein
MLPSQTLSFPFAAGLLTRGNKQAKPSPALDICKDVEFDELAGIAGLRTRYPYANLSANIFGGGTLSNCRKLVENGGELLCFTKDKLYSWNAQLAAWVSKGTHLAVKVSETPRFVSPGDQVDGDRAELSGTIVYCWTELLGSNSKGYVAAVDKTTGSVLMAPTALAGSAARLRVTALSTKILLSFYDGIAGLYAYALDPASPATALAGASTTLTNSNFGTYYDIARIGSTDQAVFACRRSPTTSYLVGTVTGALVVATSTKARTCTGPIAVSVAPNATQVQIVRANVTDLQGDLITISTLADVYTAQAIGTAITTPDQIAAAHRSVQNGGAYRCYVFWDAGEDDAPSDWTSKSNWVDTANTLGTQANFVRYLGIASRAFDYDGNVYVWGVFAQASGEGYNSLTAQLQNTYFLYRDDAFLANAKAATARAGGFVNSPSCLPNVTLVGTATYAWCGTERRIVPVGTNGDKAYADRGPRDISIAFDSNAARRCVRLGQTMYVTGGEILQYDGQQLTEVGFHVYPWNMDPAVTGGGNLNTGTYAYRATLCWPNAAGDVDRSTSATTATEVVVTDGKKILAGGFPCIYTTHKSNVALQVWRTQKNPNDDAPLYLVTSQDPASTTNPNRYLSNLPTAAICDDLEDDISDDDLLSLPSSPENGAVLENMCPPSATIMIASDVRLFLAGIAGDPDRLWYSKQRNAGEVAAFHESLVVDVPQAGGDITAIAFLSGTLIVFREHAIYELPGDGFDNTLGGGNYGPARVLSSEVGAESQEAVVQVPEGLLFKCSKGWYILNRAGGVQYVGDAVYAYDSEAVLAAHVMPAQHQVRILTSSRMLVWDYRVNQWGEWTIASGVDAALWNDQHLYLTSSGPKYQRTDYTGVDYGFDIETTWIKTTNDLQGRGILRAIQLLAEFRGAHAIRARLARNYQSDGAGGWSYFQDKTWDVTPTVVGGPLQLKIAPSIKRPIQAIKVRLTALAVGGAGNPTGETCKLTGLSLAVADEGGLYSGLPAAQKQ